MTKPKIILVGAGGHCRSCIDVIEQEGRFDILGVVDQDVSGKPSNVLGYPLMGPDKELPDIRKQCDNALIVVGQINSAAVRIRLYEQLKNLGFNLPSIISPLAHVSRHAFVGEGTVIMHGAIVNAAASVGSNCILNSRCLIEHDAVIGDHIHVSTGAIVNGTSKIGKNSFVGSGAVVVHGVDVPANSFVRAGRLVVSEKDYRKTAE